MSSNRLNFNVIIKLEYIRGVIILAIGINHQGNS